MLSDARRTVLGKVVGVVLDASSPGSGIVCLSMQPTPDAERHTSAGMFVIVATFADDKIHHRAVLLSGPEV